MSELLTSHALTCPHCWEQIEIVVDRSVPAQQYVEDCSVCCRPILLSVTVQGDDGIEVAAEATE
jgi:hypothetical protein